MWRRSTGWWVYVVYLVGPSRMSQSFPQIVEHFIRDMNSKRFHYNKLPVGDLNEY